MPPADRLAVVAPALFTGSSERRYYVHHFAHDTIRDLSHSDFEAAFWRQQVLKLCHASEPVTSAVVAVAAAHHFFAKQQLACDPSATTRESLQVACLRHYNHAIAQIIPRTDTAKGRGDTVEEKRTILLCCLLFMCFEGMTGRYGEAVRHYRAGSQILRDLEGMDADGDGVDEMTGIFSRFGLSASVLLDDPAVLHHDRKGAIVGPRPPQSKAFDRMPFRSLREATHALRELDTELFNMAPTQAGSATPRGSLDPNPDTPRSMPPLLLERLNQAFWIWNTRFELTALAYNSGGMSLSDQCGLLELRLQQGIWMESMMAWSSPAKPPPFRSNSLASILDNAIALHAALKKRHQREGRDVPAFAFTGTLVATTSFVATESSDPVVRARAVQLLRKMHRREGLWDSDELAELHEATTALPDAEKWYEREVEGGIPGYLAKVAEIGEVRLENGLLVMAREVNGAS